MKNEIEMNFLARHIQLFGLLLFAGFLTAAAAMYWGVPQFGSHGELKSSNPNAATCDHGSQGHAQCMQQQEDKPRGSCCPPKTLPACPVTSPTGRTETTTNEIERTEK